MNFNALLKEIPQTAESHEDAKSRAEAVSTMATYELVDDKSSLEQMHAELEKAMAVCFEIETHGSLNLLLAELIGVGFAVKPGLAWYLPVRGKLGTEHVIQFLKALFANKKIEFYSIIKNALHVLESHGIHVYSLLSFDTNVGLLFAAFAIRIAILWSTRTALSGIYKDLYCR